MKINTLIIISLMNLGALSVGAREVQSPSLGRFSQSDGSYDYGSTNRAEVENPDEPGDTAQLRAKGGSLIAGFPEGCAYATMDEPLPEHYLGYGRIKFMGSSWAFQYMDQNAPGPFAIAEVASNVGLMGQSLEQDLSVDLWAVTPQDRYVVAQLLDRSDMGLGPIVTCISPVFSGTIEPGQAIVFGRDYWNEYERFREFRREEHWRGGWDRWRKKWKNREYDWRKPGRDKRHERDRGPGKRPIAPVPETRPHREPEGRKRPKAMHDRGDHKNRESPKKQAQHLDDNIGRHRESPRKQVQHLDDNIGRHRASPKKPVQHPDEMRGHQREKSH